MDNKAGDRVELASATTKMATKDGMILDLVNDLHNVNCNREVSRTCSTRWR
jgi:hypothetical protein